MAPSQYRCGSVLLAALLLLVTVCLPGADALNFAVIGDWGMGGYKSGWFPEIRSANAHNAVCEKLGCNFTISCGDNIYVGNVLQGLQDSFEAMFTSPAPFFPSVGNHDNAGPQLEYTKKSKRWRFPSTFYTFSMPIDDTGYTVQIFSVNTNDGSLGGGGQYAWLESELKRSTARWKIIFGHHPTVGSGRHKRVSTVGRLHDLMARYNAQVFFCGHDHIVDISNVDGRIVAISGAMARGGMMLRGIGGSNRRFTLTHPGENNKFAQDWPAYGLITVRLSPNVMNLQVWDHYEAIQYDFSVTHDWIEQSKTLPASERGKWPTPAVVLAARKAELTLPKGPGGGTAFSPDGSAVGSAPAGPAPTIDVNAPTLPQATVQQQVLNDDKAFVAERPRTHDFRSFAVSATPGCPTCRVSPVVGQPFEIFVSGITVTSASRAYLTSSPIGCDLREKADLVQGTNVITPQGNVMEFLATGAASEAYLCFSENRGRSYVPLQRQDSFFGEKSFIIRGASGTASSNGTAATAIAATTAPLPAGPTTTTPRAQATTDSGHSTLTLIMVAVFCIVGGSVGAAFVVKLQGAQRYSERVPTTSSE